MAEVALFSDAASTGRHNAEAIRLICIRVRIVTGWAVSCFVREVVCNNTEKFQRRGGMSVVRAVRHGRHASVGRSEA